MDWINENKNQNQFWKKENKKVDKYFLWIIIILLFYIFFDKNLNKCLSLEEQTKILYLENQKTYSEIQKIKKILK